MATYDELMAAAREADRRGEGSDARRLLQLAAQARRSQPAKSGSAVDTFSDFGRGVTAGLKGASHAGQRLLWKAAGALGMDDAEDMLDIVTAKQLDARRDNARFRERSPTAFGVGEITGETLFTLPIGGAGSVAARGTLQAVRTGVSLARGGSAVANTGILAGAAGLSGEGAAIGAYMSPDDVAGGATEGAAFNLVGGAAINGVTRVGGEVLRTVMRKERALGAVADTLTDTSRRVRQAADDGGYTLDGATAHATTRSHDEVARMRQDPPIDQRFLNHRANVEGQVTERATTLASRYGPTSNPTSFQTATRPAQRTLTAMRLMDERRYRQAYREFDRIAAETNTPLPTEQLYTNLAEFIEGNANTATESLAGKINHDMARYGVRPKSAREASLGANELLMPTGRAKAPKPLSLENVEDLIQDINAHWSPSLNAGERRYIGQVKELLEAHVDNALTQMGESAGAGAAVREAGQAARSARRAFSENWNANDIIQKMTERTEGGEWAMDYSKVATALSGVDSARHLDTIKARLLTAPNGQAAWRSMQQAPLMEALYEATRDTAETVMEGGVIKFNHKAFERVLNRQLKSERAKVTLWGAEGTAEIQRALDAWKLRYRRPDTSGSSNPSGTAMTLLKQLRFLPSGRTRGAATAVASALPLIGASVQRGAREQAADAVLRGQTVPQRVQEEIAADILQQWESEFVGADGRKYGDMLRRLLRTGAVIEFVDE